ncbi:hypothetical protein [Amphritea sp.]|uniref:hypothetical protein n=1 Tax=Amphritea sp. TaxID=1872502 RepID=UPI003A8FE255
MKKALYVTSNMMLKKGDGIAKKIISQKKALVGLGYSVDFSCKEKSGGSLALCGSEEKITFDTPLKYSYFKCLAKILKDRLFEYDLVYIRNPHGGLYSLWMLYFLKIVRKKSKKIILEIPHFPYDIEASEIKTKVSVAAHKLIRPFLYKYVDTIVFMGESIDEIWNIPAIQLHNCCDADEIEESLPGSREWDDFNFIGVANLAYWHGYDRLINGLYDYYKNGGRGDIKFHIVGDTEPTLSILKRLVCSLNMQEKIIFHGRLDGSELNLLFIGDVVGVDSLGRHRCGSSYNDSLKSKEYCFRDIPFIKSHMDVSFDNVDFVYDVSAEESNVDVDAIQVWLKNLRFNKGCIRNFAEIKFNWESQMQKFLDDLS